MRVLIIAATAGEVAPLIASLGVRATTESRLQRLALDRHDVDLLTTGVGMVATAAWTSRMLAQSPYDVAFDIGVCGSFDANIAPGTVVHVTSECLSELGAQDGHTFLSLADLQLLSPSEFPFTDGRLVNASPPSNATLGALPAVSGVTVNTVHGDDASIAQVVARFHPQVESMEGAAFMYACMIGGVPFAQVRAVSNVVERRNRAAWKMREAIDALTATTLAILRTL